MLQKVIDKYYDIFLRKRNFKRHFRQLKYSEDDRFVLDWKDRYPCLDDATGQTGFDRHYVYHTAWAARVLARGKTQYHIDISSDLRFVTLVSAFVEMAFYDYRPANIKLPGLKCYSADILSLPFADHEVFSLSCMHVIEHIGLGRYGDTLDAFGDIKAAAELSRVLSRNGSLMIAVPVGIPKVLFNAHRIYSYDMVLDLFEDLALVEFSIISNIGDDGHPLRVDADPEMVSTLDYGCGCFLFTKA